MHKWLRSIDFLTGERGNWLSVSWLLTPLGEGRSQGQAGSRSPGAQPDHFYVFLFTSHIQRAGQGQRGQDKEP